MDSHGQGDPITFYLWCVVGAIAGALFGLVAGSRGTVARLEEVGVGVFGAFIGGEFVASMLLPAAATPGDFRAPALGTAIGGALFMLLLLKTMRKAVGPLRNGKSVLRKR
jgi:uncharacterized membrane protein YeaQ/YmgE (transglycosylase-associated protein family)